MPPHYKAALAQLGRISMDVEILKACNYVSLKAPATYCVSAAGLAAAEDALRAERAPSRFHR